MSHTPGPWKWLSNDNRYGDDTVPIKCGEILIAETFSGVLAGREDFSIDEAEANARLIAAAPKMLEALKELADLVDSFVGGGYRPDSFTTQPARAAISEATGGQL